MMKIVQFILSGAIALSMLQISSNVLLANDHLNHRVQMSLTLSGHLLLGIGYCYFWDAHQGAQATFYLAPEKGLPYGLAAGYQWEWGNRKWQPTLGAEFMVLASPPDPEKRKFLPMILINPGLSYQLDNEQIVQSRLWVAYFLKRARVKVAPIGLELVYGRKF